jgi:hypothetical protein
MRTIGEQQRICSYCGGEPFATTAEFSEHWRMCPRRIQLGYIPIPTELIPARIELLKDELRKLGEQALLKLKEVAELEQRLKAESSTATAVG